MLTQDHALVKVTPEWGPACLSQILGMPNAFPRAFDNLARRVDPKYRRPFDGNAAMSLISLTEGSVFAGRYRIVRSIAQGGMGAVYEVVHTETQRRRALKVMLPRMHQGLLLERHGHSHQPEDRLPCGPVNGNMCDGSGLCVPCTADWDCLPGFVCGGTACVHCEPPCQVQ
jgi:hypothetical protein